MKFLKVFILIAVLVSLAMPLIACSPTSPFWKMNPAHELDPFGDMINDALWGDH